MAMEDRISQLPDDLLGIIISLLEIKQAVQTCILSNRWKCVWWTIWLSMSDLDFNFRRQVESRGDQEDDVDSRGIVQFVDRFFAKRLDHKYTDIRKFHLSVESSSGVSAEDLVARCVLYAVIYGVQVLHLEGLTGHDLMLPLAFFCCRTLRELKLTHEFESIYYAPQLCLRFPEVEKLSLLGSSFLWVVVVCAKLRDVEIINDNEEALRLAYIQTPGLTSFKYQGTIPAELVYFSVDFPVLEEAFLNFDLTSTMIKDKTNTSKFMNFLQKFGNAKIVTLSLDIIRALEADIGAIEQSSSSPFPNMTCLKLMMKGKKRRTEVLRSVMDYLTEGCLCGESLVVELPDGVHVVEDRLIKTCKFKVFKICRN